MQCRVCSGSRVETFLDLGDQPHCNSLLTEQALSGKEPYYPLIAGFCHDCTTVQLTHTVPKEVMFGEYLYVSGTTKTLREHFAQSAKRLVERVGLKTGDLVLDIGSNDGTWLKCYAPYGIKTLGVEPAKNIAKLANDAGIVTLNRFFNTDAAKVVLRGHGRPRLITAAGVFFHLEELHSVTEGIRDLLGEDGIFCVQAIYLGEILKHTEFDNIYHEHLTYWTLCSINALFAQYDLEVYAVDVLPIHGGSLELMIASKGTHPIEESVTAMMAAEKAHGLGEFSTYKAFADRVWNIKNALWEILSALKSSGKTVHCFGAPAKGATMLNSFGISVKDIPTAVEKNPLKIGKYIPGARIPIVDEDLVAPPDAYLILPWNFLKEFLTHKREYIMKGGQFIVPIPFPYIIDAANIDSVLAKLGKQAAS